MTFNNNSWLKISLINLLIVAFIGLVMRYKIGFEFPYFNQKNLQYSHSNFAFSGWVSHTLITLLVSFLEKKGIGEKGMENYLKKYNTILIANLLCAYGMLIFFTVQGYGLYSIFFSIASIIVSYVFGYHFIKDLKHITSEDSSKNWFKAAILFNILSSFGSFALAYMMIIKNIHQEEYLASIFYYLHFQYNGWFFFACMGLLFSFLKIAPMENPRYKKIFRLFFISCIPTYFLSTLWLDLPRWIYIPTLIAVFLQTYAWFAFLFIIIKTKRELLIGYPFFLRYILLFIGFATSVKLVLQLASIIPAISDLAFGFRPIVIAYLHLILLAIISLFLLFYIYANQLIFTDNKVRFGIIIFSVGVLFNEIILAVQGIASLSYTIIPYVNEMLFVAAILLVTGIGLTAAFSIKKVKVKNF